MGSRLPEIVLAAIVDVEPNVPEAVHSALRARGSGWTAMQIALFAKHHHLDDFGTIDTYAIGQFGARPLELGTAEHVRDQVRRVLNAERDAIASTLGDQGFGHSAATVPALAVEIDIQQPLAVALSEPQPWVSEVTPPPRTIGDTGEGIGVGS